MIKIKNLIVNNGIKEYDFDQIHSDKKIFQLANSVIILSGLEKLSDKINSEKGLVYITCKSDFSLGSAELRNASIELLEEYNNTKP
ncbi:hypothetical protein ACPX19_11245 [Winogradskyella sp. HB-48]|uniref:hypothetical protein n=1 Tax=Winogradskyella sp. HB-48 TaxID=3416808 RepID=UPI003CF3C1E5